MSSRIYTLAIATLFGAGMFFAAPAAHANPGDLNFGLNMQYPYDYYNAYPYATYPYGSYPYGNYNYPYDSDPFAFESPFFFSFDRDRDHFRRDLSPRDLDHRGFDHRGFERRGFERRGFDRRGFERRGFDHGLRSYHEGMHSYR